jgi:hypothetical protein
MQTPTSLLSAYRQRNKNRITTADKRNMDIEKKEIGVTDTDPAVKHPVL